MLIGSDDFGYSDSVNALVVQGLEKAQFGFVSVMVNMPGSAGALAAVGEYPTRFGLHFNITEGRPLSDPSDVSSLVNEQGELLGWPGLIQRAIFGKLDPSHIEREARAQLEELKRHGSIDFLNSHHHIHFYPTIARALQPLIVEYRIPSIRSPRKLWWRNVSPPFLAKALTIQTMGIRHHSPTPHLGDYLFDLDWCGPTDRARTNLLKVLPETTELACHPLTDSFPWILAHAPSNARRKAH